MDRICRSDRFHGIGMHLKSSKHPNHIFFLALASCIAIIKKVLTIIIIICVPFIGLIISYSPCDTVFLTSL